MTSLLAALLIVWFSNANKLLPNNKNSSAVKTQIILSLVMTDRKGIFTGLKIVSSAVMGIVKRKPINALRSPLTIRLQIAIVRMAPKKIFFFLFRAELAKKEISKKGNNKSRNIAKS